MARRAHGEQCAASPQPRGGVRPKILTPAQPISTAQDAPQQRAKTLPGIPGGLNAVAHDDVRAQAALLFRRAMQVCGVTNSWLARKLGIHRNTIQRKADPDHRKPLTVPNLLLIRLVHPGLYSEIVHALQELEAADAADWQPAECHAADAAELIGQLFDVAKQLRVASGRTKRLRDQMDCVWAELEMLCREARRHLRRDR